MITDMSVKEYRALYKRCGKKLHHATVKMIINIIPDSYSVATKTFNSDIILDNKNVISGIKKIGSNIYIMPKNVDIKDYIINNNSVTQNDLNKIFQALLYS